MPNRKTLKLLPNLHRNIGSEIWGCNKMANKFKNVASFDSASEVMKYMDYLPAGTSDEEKLNYLVKYILVAIIEFSV